MLPTQHEIASLVDFKSLLEDNPGWVIIKFGAEWCKPCQRIESRVLEWFRCMPNTIQTVLVDIDESFEVYAYMKNKRMIQGIPAILAYQQGNLNYVFDHSVASSHPGEVDAFFQRFVPVDDAGLLGTGTNAGTNAVMSMAFTLK